MRILQLGKFYPIKGGVEKVMYNLAQGLGKQGTECDMLCCAFPDGSIENRKQVIRLNDNARIIVVPSIANMASTIISPALVLELRRLVRERQYDIIHIHHPDPMATVALFLSPYKGKVIVHWHSDIVKQKTLLKFYLPLQNWLLKRADRIVGTSPVYVAGSEHLARWHFKTSYLPIGIDGLEPDQAGSMQIRNRFPGKKIVFALGRAVHYKGFQFLVDAAGYLPQDYVIVIGGSGVLLPELKRKAQELGVDDRVIFPGFIPENELPSWFGACSVFALSSIMKTEAYAIVQIEAMSCSKPVVSTQIEGSGVSWVNAHKDSGLIVSPRDGKAIAKAITDICEDTDTYNAYCLRARQRFEVHFTKALMISSCMDIYDYVLGNKPNTYATMLALLGKVLWDNNLDYSAFAHDPGLWKMVMNTAAAQNIYSLLYDALPCDVPDDVLAIWTDHVKRIEQHNHWTEIIANAQEKAWKNHRLEYAMLKGSSISQLYKHPEHRGCGDIDWYFTNEKDWKTALEIAKKNADSKIYFDSDGDISYIWKGITVEHHHDWTHLSSRRSRRHLGKPSITDGRISPIDSLIVLNAHILHHALTSGAGLKQFADLAMAYRTFMPLTNVSELVSRLEAISLTRWTGLLHAALVEITGIDSSLLPVPASASHKDTMKLLHLVANDGIFGRAKKHRYSGFSARFMLLVRYCPRECFARYFHLGVGLIKRFFSMR